MNNVPLCFFLYWPDKWSVTVSASAQALCMPDNGETTGQIPCKGSPMYRQLTQSAHYIRKVLQECTTVQTDIAELDFQLQKCSICLHLCSQDHLPLLGNNVCRNQDAIREA